MAQNVNEYVISGYGVCLPKAPNSDAFWTLLTGQETAFVEKPLFGSDFPPQTLAAVEEIPHGLTKRQIKKLDRFTLLSVAAMRQTFEMSHLPLDDTEFLDQCGILLGNNTGGWTFVEPQMGPLYAEHMTTLSPYVATAWFPTAVQGEISIPFKLGGYSKTFAAETLSAGFAFEHAAAMLDSGVLTSALVGGVEAPLTQLVYNACMESGLLSEQGTYRPYSSQAEGALLGEGAALFILEPENSARQRGAQVHARFSAVGKGGSFSQAMRACLHRGGKSARDIQYIMLSGRAEAESDQQEYAAISDVFAAHPEVLMSAPKAKYGNLLGADMAANIAAACLALAHQTVPPTCSDTQAIIPPSLGRHVTGAPVSAEIRNILINGRDNYGQCMSVLISA